MTNLTLWGYGLQSPLKGYTIPRVPSDHKRVKASVQIRQISWKTYENKYIVWRGIESITAENMEQITHNKGNLKVE